jgi:predicted ATPase
MQRREVKRFVLTGTPGSGKTAIIRQLEIDGFSVVEEAATDLIALTQAQGNHRTMDASLVYRFSLQVANAATDSSVVAAG